MLAPGRCDHRSPRRAAGPDEDRRPPAPLCRGRRGRSHALSALGPPPRVRRCPEQARAPVRRSTATPYGARPSPTLRRATPARTRAPARAAPPARARRRARPRRGKRLRSRSAGGTRRGAHGGAPHGARCLRRGPRSLAGRARPPARKHRLRWRARPSGCRARRGRARRAGPRPAPRPRARARARGARAPRRVRRRPRPGALLRPRRRAPRSSDPRPPSGARVLRVSQLRSAPAPSASRACSSSRSPGRIVA